MQRQDFIFAAALANTMDWKMTPEDFEYIKTIEPDGCFVLLDNSVKIGIATSISYGRVGWFGNFIIKQEFRGVGAGSLLIRHALDYLHSKGVEMIGLYSYPSLVKFYEGFGFKAGEQISVLHATAVIPSKTRCPQIGKSNVKAIVEFDKECFGGDRHKLLESIFAEENSLGFFMREHSNVVGYVVARIFGEMAEIGPLVCQPGHTSTAIRLLQSVFRVLNNREVYVWGMPKKENAVAKVLFKYGFKEDFLVKRMLLGKSLSQNCIYLAESLERG